MILDDIVLKKKERLVTLKKEKPLAYLKEVLSHMSLSKEFPFRKAFSTDGFTIIGELKKASPSKGIISESFDYKAIGKCYEEQGIGAISVLTEEDFFLGKNEYVTNMKSEVTIPLLRKDFIIDPYQIYEAKVIKADAILLIARILTDEQLIEYYNLAEKLALDVLLEVHTEEEIQRVINLGGDTIEIIGINNRDLDTFEVDLNNSKSLAEALPCSVIKISESGIQTKEDIEQLKAWGFNGALIGETLMRSSNLKQ